MAFNGVDNTDLGLHSPLLPPPRPLPPAPARAQRPFSHDKIETISTGHIIINGEPCRA